MPSSRPASPEIRRSAPRGPHNPANTGLGALSEAREVSPEEARLYGTSVRPSPPRQASMDIDNGHTGVDYDGKDVTFRGDAKDLASLLLMVQLKQTLDPALNNDNRKCAFLASKFRGRALDWLVTTVARNSNILQDYDAFTDLLKEVWGIPEKAEKIAAEVRLTKLHQTADIALFNAEFEALSSELNLTDSAKKLLYASKLSRPLQDRVIVMNESSDSYRELKEEATRIATSLRALGEPAGASVSSGKKKKKQKGRGAGGSYSAAPKKEGTLKVNSIAIKGEPA